MSLGFFDEHWEADLKCFRKACGHVQRGVTNSALNHPDIGWMQSSKFREPLLGKPRSNPPGADGKSESFRKGGRDHRPVFGQQCPKSSTDYGMSMTVRRLLQGADSRGVHPKCGRHLRIALTDPLERILKLTFVRARCAIAYLHPGLHPDGYEAADSGLPRGLRRFAAEARRRTEPAGSLYLFSGKGAA